MILPSITSPKDIKNLSSDELNLLAIEIRQRIIDVLSINGGHLASNLGSVELTLALHKVFDSPSDKFIWDVSHQTYTHKIITGRNKNFSTLRTFKGMSGFSHPEESEHDHFFSGHAGTALSLALGVAKARDHSNEQNYVIPIIGDATLTCGMSLEALNNLGREHKRFIVILNDNAMSISKNVGAITKILSRLFSNPTTNKIYQEIDTVISKIPSLGPTLSKHGHKFTESIKNLFSPAAFFEQYGLSYIGPVDGHNINDLIDVLNGLKDSNWPVIVHVLTNKGQGMDEAIKNPVSYHGVKPFDPYTGKFLPTTSSKPTFPKVFGKHILEMAEKDPDILTITPAMSAGSCLDELMKKFPDRCLDVGIAESHAVTFAGGISLNSKIKVVVSIYSSFLQRAFDNLFHDCCIQGFPIVLCIDRAGINGPDGVTHHGIYDISFLNAMPNMVIAQPRNANLLKELLNSCFSYARPTAIRYPNLPADETETPLSLRELGKAEILATGKDLLIITLGTMYKTGLEVREELVEYGIEATVLDPIFVKPLDVELLSNLFQTHKKLITIEEHGVNSGLGSIVNNFLITNGFTNIEVINFGISESFLDHGSYSDLLNDLGLTKEKILSQVCARFNLKKNLTYAKK